MRLELVSTNLKITPKIEASVEAKIAKVGTLIDSLFSPDDQVRVRVLIIRHPVKSYELTATLFLPRQTLRAGAVNNRFEAALNEITDKLTRQIRRYRSKLAHEASFEAVAERKRSRYDKNHGSA